MTPRVQEASSCGSKLQQPRRPGGPSMKPAVLGAPPSAIYRDLRRRHGSQGNSKQKIEVDSVQVLVNGVWQHQLAQQSKREGFGKVDQVAPLPASNNTSCGWAVLVATWRSYITNHSEIGGHSDILQAKLQPDMKCAQAHGLLHAALSRSHCLSGRACLTTLSAEQAYEASAPLSLC